MSDDQRVYSDEEFALILRTATELANRAEPTATSSSGLTLAEMKAAAAQVGLDPALVEHAARLVATNATASPLERLVGGPLRHSHQVRFPIKLDEKRAAQLLSAVRISAGLPGRTDVGTSSSLGMTWHDGGEVEALGVTARAEEAGTTISVVLDRRGTLGFVGVVAGITIFFTVLFSIFALYPEAPALGFGGLVVGVGGVLALARGYWATSTKRVQERISGVLEAIGQNLTRPRIQAPPSGVAEGDALSPATNASAVVKAELTGA